MPIAENVPISVDTTLDTTAIISVFLSAASSSGVLSDANIDLYDSKLNPLSKEKIDVLKNENTIISTLGAYSSARSK